MSPRAAAVPAPEPTSTRDAILDAAERCFADRGFAGVSMREIAAEAGLRNQASLYHHFTDKRALYEAALARGVAPIVALMEESGGGWLDPGEVERNVDRLLDYLIEHPHLPRLIQRAGLDDSRSLRRAVRTLLRPLYTEGLRLLQGAVGPWEPTDLPQLATGLYHLIFGYFADAALLMPHARSSQPVRMARGPVEVVHRFGFAAARIPKPPVALALPCSFRQ